MISRLDLLSNSSNAADSPAAVAASDRPRRAASSPPAFLPRTTRELDAEFLSELDCGPTACSFISCVVGPLTKKAFTLIKIRSRLWVRTLDKVTRKDVEISSKLVTRVTKLPYGVNPEYLGYQTHHVTSQVSTSGAMINDIRAI